MSLQLRWDLYKAKRIETNELKMIRKFRFKESIQNSIPFFIVRRDFNGSKILGCGNFSPVRTHIYSFFNFCLLEDAATYSAN
ncbi:MAG: transcriptional regulator [Candidatus Scalindua rubra]|uniref:Transcriptional regulator n=1 Tax=Candidatus Scalindua rubra TaxID=1872076 RepID=A0A1E3X7F8_9BACT|nr:MAG: transcriptional regulator [Candidatus Scalindua rubra]